LREGSGAMALINGTEYGDYLEGTPGADRIYGFAGDDQLFGLAWRDSLDGGDGDDWLVGGAGRDTLNGGDGVDTASYDETALRMSIDLEDGVVSFPASIWLEDRLHSIENASAGQGDDTIVGSDDANALHGNAGNDSLDGRGGNDTLYGDAGDDSLTGSGDTLYGGTGADTFVGGHGSVLYGYDGGEGGVDHISNAFRAPDTVIYEWGDLVAVLDTRAFVLDGNDTLWGQGGNDRIEGGAGSDTAVYSDTTASVRIDLVQQRVTFPGTSWLSETLVSIENAVGGSGRDRLIGTAGANVLDGGLGADTIDGGAGRDTVSFASHTQGVRINLALQTAGILATGVADTLVSIESATGGAGSDLLYGDGRANALDGGLGNDRIWAGAETIPWRCRSATIRSRAARASTRSPGRRPTTLTTISSTSKSTTPKTSTKDTRATSRPTSP
jgi:Ca2+-binding RTX toxin-like protein